jgi:hypothetical protein
MPLHLSCLSAQHPAGTSKWAGHSPLETASHQSSLLLGERQHTLFSASLLDLQTLSVDDHRHVFSISHPRLLCKSEQWLSLQQSASVTLPSSQLFRSQRASLALADNDTRERRARVVGRAYFIMATATATATAAAESLVRGGFQKESKLEAMCSGYTYRLWRCDTGWKVLVFSFQGCYLFAEH